DGRQLRADRRAPLANPVAAAAVEGRRPEQLLAAARVALERQNGPGPGVRAESARRWLRLGQVALEEIANRAGRELGRRGQQRILFGRLHRAAPELPGG